MKKQLLKLSLVVATALLVTTSLVGCRSNNDQTPTIDEPEIIEDYDLPNYDELYYPAEADYGSVDNDDDETADYVPSNLGVTSEAAALITNGMHYAEVVTIIGEEPTSVTQVSNTKTVLWMGDILDMESITVMFTDDYVTAVTIMGL